MNIAKILFIILAIVALAAVAIYLMGQFEVTRPLYDTITGALGNAKDTIMGALTNPVGAVMSALGAVGGIGAAIGIYSSLKGKLTTSVNTANSEISKLSAQKNDAEKKLLEYESSTKGTVEGYETKIKELETQLKATPNDSELQKELTQTQQFLTSSQLQKKELEDQYKTLQTKYNTLEEQMQKLLK